MDTANLDCLFGGKAFIVVAELCGDLPQPSGFQYGYSKSNSELKYGPQIKVK